MSGNTRQIGTLRDFQKLAQGWPLGTLSYRVTGSRSGIPVETLRAIA